MAEYTPAYSRNPPLTIEQFEARVDELRPIHAYAREHDDVLVLDELFCHLVALEHGIMRWEQENQHQPRVVSSVKELDRSLKWAWLARDEEDHAGGMYAGKLGEAIEVLQDLLVFLWSLEEIQDVPQEPEHEGMTRDEADALAATIKAKLPQAELEVKPGEHGRAWVVEARNPRRGTSQIFLSADEFEQLMQSARRA